ncbi:MAG TPA: LPS assembly protein LptD [Clostridia bacterium]|nr:LPS assembly protein LptD [Clostridia bacterium]
MIIRAREQEKSGDIYRLRGEVEVSFRMFTFRATEITYNSASGDLEAIGHVMFDGGPHDEHLEASRATYNVNTESGKFYNVIGTVGASFRGRNVVLTTSNPFVFSGKLVEKSGRDRLIVHRGSITSCSMPKPKWTFEAEKIDVVVGEDAKMYHSTFRIRRIPIFYFPYVQHPVENLGRQSGFLIPTIGRSSRKGNILGESFFWAINRSADATIGAEYFSRRGWSQHGEFRARPSEKSNVELRYFGVFDRGFGPTGQDQGGQDIRLNTDIELPHGFRAVTNVNYLSSFLFRLAFSETFSQAVNSEVKSVVFISKSYNGFSFGGMSSRYQNFQSTAPGDRILIAHAPTFEASSVERRIGGTRAMWSFDASAEGVTRREPDFVTADLVGRFDLAPRLSLPLIIKGWSLRADAGLRDTFYTQRLQPTPTTVGTLINDTLERHAVEGAVELRPPSISRVFDRTVLDRKLKHTIEPRVIYRYVAGVDSFPATIRFDARDILSNTSEVEVGFVNSIYAKRTGNGKQRECAPEVQPERKGNENEAGTIAGEAAVPKRCEDSGVVTREVLRWELAQKYFLNQDFGGALVPGRRNVFTTTADLTGIAFLTEPRRLSPFVSRLRVLTSANTDVQWNLDYDPRKGRINASTVLANYRIGDFFFGGSHAFLHAPGEVMTLGPSDAQERFSQFRILLGFGHPNKRGFSAGASTGFDANFGFLQYSSAQTSYNWDCCGVSVEYRRFALGSVRNENQFRFAFTLANVGTFGNLRRQERLF